MKTITTIIFFTSLLLSSISYGVTKIHSKEASFYEGENVIACGVLKEVIRFKRGLYLNMDNHFPKQSLTLVVWEDDLTEFKEEHGPLQQLVNREICGKGKVTDYRGRSQISLYNAFSLKANNIYMID
ncbi:hypothetical protein N9R79_07180 [Vibrio sp.]|nr:hypothetical protein [Vibrio sp.]